MDLTRMVVASVVAAGGVAVGLAGAAGAASPNLLGTYTFEAQDGESATWTITPCVQDTDNCVRVAETGNSKRAPWSANAYSSVGSWILFVDQPDAILCADGASAPGRNNYSWDGAGLAGYASIFSDGVCGGKPESLAIPFTLTKTGSGPVQYPTAPVDDQPHVAGVPVPAGPLPAEADPALVATPNELPVTSDPLTEAEVATPGFNNGERR